MTAASGSGKILWQNHIYCATSPQKKKQQQSPIYVSSAPLAFQVYL